jgi:hypothetical protein
MQINCNDMVCEDEDCSRNQQVTLDRPTNYRHGGERIIEVGIRCCFHHFSTKERFDLIDQDGVCCIHLTLLNLSCSFTLDYGRLVNST